MISVFCRGLTFESRQIITETFGFAKVTADHLQIIDLDHYDLDITKHNFMLCIGTTIKDICRDLVQKGYYTSADLLQLMRNDIVDESNGGFLLYSIYVPPEFWRTGAREDQVTVWNKIVSFSEMYNKLYTPEKPFNDLLPDFNHQPEPAEETHEAVENAMAQLDQNLIRFEDDVVIPPTVQAVERAECVIDEADVQDVKQLVKTVAVRSYDLDQVITIDVADYINQLSELINISDIGNSKSLSSYGHIILHTNNADLHVFSTVAELNKCKEGHRILLKDLIGILKAASVFNAGKVSFHKSEIAV